MMVCMAWSACSGRWTMYTDRVLGQFPHGLGVMGEERRRGAEQPLVPGQRRWIVGDGYAREQVDGHAAMLGTHALMHVWLGRGDAPGTLRRRAGQQRAGQRVHQEMAGPEVGFGGPDALAGDEFQGGP
jgi:hypothetical protein